LRSTFVGLVNAETRREGGAMNRRKTTWLADEIFLIYFPGILCNLSKKEREGTGNSD
jgi:hypothetical protein